MARHCGYKQGAFSGATIGIQATITTCALELPPDAKSFSVVWTGVNNDAIGDADKQRWAQIGYAHYYDGEVPSVKVYVEVQSGPNDLTDYYREYFGPPAKGDIVYQAELDAAAGAWSFFSNGVNIKTYQHDGWKTAQNLAAGFFGETSGGDAPFAGTEDTPCDFTGCALKVGAAYQAVDFTTGYVTWNDNGELMPAEGASNAFTFYETSADEF